MLHIIRKRVKSTHSKMTNDQVYHSVNKESQMSGVKRHKNEKICLLFKIYFHIEILSFKP